MIMVSKTLLALGNHCQVVLGSPLEKMYAEVTRRTLDNKNNNGWIPEQTMTIEQALILYAKNAAYASFDQIIKGTLELGKLADFVIFSEDLRKIDTVNIRDVKIISTYIGGKKVVAN